MAQTYKNCAVQTLASVMDEHLRAMTGAVDLLRSAIMSATWPTEQTSLKDGILDLLEHLDTLAFDGKCELYAFMKGAYASFPAPQTPSPIGESPAPVIEAAE
jgi:hypothetical protein